MKIAWLGLIVEIVILSLFKPIINDSETVILLVIAINILFVSIGLSKYREKYSLLFYLGYGIRLLAMFWDIYARDIFTFPGSGTDSEIYFQSAVAISKNLSLILKPIDGGVYSKLLGIIYYISVPERMLGQYINVLVGVSIIIIIYKILKYLDINDKTMLISLLFISFFPNAIIFSAIFIRENFIAIFTLLSFFYFLKWYSNASRINIVKAFILLLMASTFHAGIIGIALGYMFIIMFYKHNENKYVFNKNTIFYFVIFAIFLTFIYMNYADVFFAKFSSVNAINDIYRYASGGNMIGSDYLSGLNIDNWWKLILYSPIKMFYFLTSPLPMNWRGFNDILAFTMDSSLYLYIMVYTLKRYKKIPRKAICTGLLIIILFTVFIFGVGVSNAGTAMRHRHKIFPIIIIFYALIHDGNKVYLLNRD